MTTMYHFDPNAQKSPSIARPIEMFEVVKIEIQKDKTNEQKDNTTETETDTNSLRSPDKDQN